MNLSAYRTLVFDCDGVVLNSNKVKTNAFYQAALPFGEEFAERLVSHHVQNGGISRYKKFEWFINEFSLESSNLDSLLESYAKHVKQGLLNCEIAPGLIELRNKTANANWLIVSGGDQQELREVFSERNIAHFFDGGIFGSPDNKYQILERELKKENINPSAIFFGDSKYDFEVSNYFNLDFIFLSCWTELPDWEAYCQANKIIFTNSLNFLK